MKGKRLRLREDLTLVSFDDKAALLDVEKRCYYDPNDTAFFLLKLMENGCSHEDLATELISKFAVSEKVAWADIDNFIEELLRLGLVETTEKAISREITYEPNKDKRAYQTPILQRQAEIMVASAQQPPTPVKWV